MFRWLIRWWVRRVERYDGEVCDDCGFPVARRVGSYWQASDELWTEK